MEYCSFDCIEWRCTNIMCCWSWKLPYPMFSSEHRQFSSSNTCWIKRNYGCNICYWICSEYWQYVWKNKLYSPIVRFYLEAVLFAVTGGPQTVNEKVYMINAQNGEVITSFGADSVSDFFRLKHRIYYEWLT